LQPSKLSGWFSTWLQYTPPLHNGVEFNLTCNKLMRNRRATESVGFSFFLFFCLQYFYSLALHLKIQKDVDNFPEVIVWFQSVEALTVGGRLETPLWLSSLTVTAFIFTRILGRTFDHKHKIIISRKVYYENTFLQSIESTDKILKKRRC
jgi:hypothetical protein